MKKLAALAALAALAVPATASAAAPAPVFGLRPLGHPKLGYYVYSLRPGATTHGAVVVTNSGTAAGTVRLYSADASTGRTSGTIYLTDQKPKAAGSWIHIAAGRLTLAPHAGKKVTFTVHVPAGQRPGQWVGGLVAESVTKTKAKRAPGKAGIQVNVRNQTIVAIQVDVPGPAAAKFAIGGASTSGQNGYQYVVLHVANTGNAFAKPTGKVTVSKGGTVVASLPFKMDTFLPQTAIDYPILLKKALGAGSYTTSVTLSYAGAGGKPETLHTTKPLTISKSDVAQVFTSAAPTQKPPTTTSSSSSGSSTPWALIAAIAAAVVVLLLLLWLVVRRRRRPVAAPPTRDDEVVPPEALERTAPPAPPAEPEPFAELPPRPEPEPTSDAPPPAPPAPTAPENGHRHYWEVAYDRGKLGDDGVWRFPHRCRECGAEVLAENIEDATAQATQG